MKRLFRYLFIHIIAVLSLMFATTTIAMPPPDSLNELETKLLMTSETALKALSPGGGSNVFPDIVRADSLDMRAGTLIETIPYVPDIYEVRRISSGLLIRVVEADQGCGAFRYHEYKPIGIMIDTAGKKGSKPKPVTPKPRYISI